MCAGTCFVLLSIDKVVSCSWPTCGSASARYDSLGINAGIIGALQASAGVDCPNTMSLSICHHCGGGLMAKFTPSGGDVHHMSP
jgi:hypothetical protein